MRWQATISIQECPAIRCKQRGQESLRILPLHYGSKMWLNLCAHRARNSSTRTWLQLTSLYYNSMYSIVNRPSSIIINCTSSSEKFKDVPLRSGQQYSSFRINFILKEKKKPDEKILGDQHWITLLLILQELLALRSKDKKSTKRIQSMLQRTKSANKAVIDDAKDDVNTAVTAAGKGFSSWCSQTCVI